MWFPHATTDGHTDAVVPLLPRCIPHAEWNVNETPYPVCTAIGFGKSFAAFAAPGFCDLFTWARPFCISPMTNNCSCFPPGTSIFTNCGRCFLRSVKEKQTRSSKEQDPVPLSLEAYNTNISAHVWCTVKIRQLRFEGCVSRLHSN